MLHIEEYSMHGMLMRIFNFERIIKMYKFCNCKECQILVDEYDLDMLIPKIKIEDNNYIIEFGVKEEYV